MAANLHISISAETIANIAGFEITNSIFTSLLVTLLLVGFAVTFGSQKLKLSAIKPIQNLVELIVEGLYKLCSDIAGPEKAKIFFPYIATSIIFILLNNWFGLLPGVGTIGVQHPVQIAQVTPVHAVTEDIHEDSVELGVTETIEVSEEGVHEESHAVESEHGKFIPILRAATADLNGTLALGLMTMFLVQFYGVKFLGLRYFTKFFNFSQGPIFTFVGILELLSDVSKILSFAFRLFGNIFAGEVLIEVMKSLVPLIGPAPFLGMEIFVGAIQALVFGMLSLVFINGATIGHDDHH